MEPMERGLSIVLITWNSARWVERCAAGIVAQSPAPVEVVVVDNASSDATRDAISRHLPGARLLRNETNRGFAAAANQGIAATRGEWVVLLNPDVHLSASYCATVTAAMIAAGERCGSGTGKLLQGQGDAIEPTGLVDSRGIRMTRSGRHFDISNGEPDGPEDDAVREVFGVSGAAAVFRRALLEDVAVGGEVFDEDFFAFREDADLAWRARLMGWSALYVPKARAWHVRTVTPEARRALPPEINMHGVKNRFLLRLKNEGAGLFLRNAPWELARDLVVLGATLTIERSSLPAIEWLWQHRASILRKRREIQRRRRVTDAALGKWFN
jgi:GT2 family glycosyltransferase